MPNTLVLKQCFSSLKSMLRWAANAFSPTLRGDNVFSFFLDKQSLAGGGRRSHEMFKCHVTVLSGHCTSSAHEESFYPDPETLVSSSRLKMSQMTFAFPFYRRYYSMEAKVPRNPPKVHCYRGFLQRAPAQRGRRRNRQRKIPSLVRWFAKLFLRCRFLWEKKRTPKMTPLGLLQRLLPYCRRTMKNRMLPTRPRRATRRRRPHQPPTPRLQYKCKSCCQEE